MRRGEERRGEGVYSSFFLHHISIFSVAAFSCG
jgi:hypothetical protein